MGLSILCFAKSAVLRRLVQAAWTIAYSTACYAVSLHDDALSGSSPSPLANTKNAHSYECAFCVGGGHGTRTHEAVTPYSLSRRAP